MIMFLCGPFEHAVSNILFVFSVVTYSFSPGASGSVLF